MNFGFNRTKFKREIIYLPSEVTIFRTLEAKVKPKASAVERLFDLSKLEVVCRNVNLFF
ncbi:MAG: hypothetical protein ACTS5A_01055 [Candidatus Hodgkinia cicadicola]